MRFLIVAIGLMLPLSSMAKIPSHVECMNPTSNGKTVFYSFRFDRQPKEIYPPRYDVWIKAKILDPSNGHEDDTVTSDDPTQPHKVVLKKKLHGQRDRADENLIYFDQAGFIRLERVRRELVVTFQLPSQSSDIATIARNCRLPEPRGGVGN